MVILKHHSVFYRIENVTKWLQNGFMDTQKPYRCSMRLKDYDYSASGYYFITICTQNRTCLFGKISDHRMMLNEIGNIVEEEWIYMGKKRSNIILDKFIVMPNHLHGVVCIDSNDLEKYGRRGTTCRARGADIKNQSNTNRRYSVHCQIKI